MEGGIEWHPSSFEAGLIGSLSEQLIELVEPPDWSDDPLARLESQQAVPLLNRQDPALQRLFPDASQDPEIAAEQRRHSEGEQRSAKAVDALLVLQASKVAAEGQPVVIPWGQEWPWLRTLAALRLVLAARLGIRSADDVETLEDLEPDDPRSEVADIYHWLEYVQSSLLLAVTGTVDD